jgi:peptide/nickel transport system permease protein
VRETAPHRQVPPLTWWLARRLLLAVVVLWGAVTLTFIGLHLLPGNPAVVIAGGLHAPSPKTVALVDHQYGFNHSLISQYWTFLSHLAAGHFGNSYQLNQPVLTLIGDQLWASVSLALGAIVLGGIGGLILALATAGRPRARAATNPLELLALSTPSFWVGILLLNLFSFRLHLFPVIGNNGISSLILPWITLALPVGAVLAIVMREGLDRALEQPFALTVRARGATEGRLRLRHALRHALLPVLTISGVTLGQLLGGIVVVEEVFARQGIGQVTVAAVTQRDFPVVIGIVVLTAAAFVVINIGTDLLYRAIDPRIRATQS